MKQTKADKKEIEKDILNLNSDDFSKELSLRFAKYKEKKTQEIIEPDKIKHEIKEEDNIKDDFNKENNYSNNIDNTTSNNNDKSIVKKSLFSKNIKENFNTYKHKFKDYLINRKIKAQKKETLLKEKKISAALAINLDINNHTNKISVKQKFSNFLLNSKFLNKNNKTSESNNLDNVNPSNNNLHDDKKKHSFKKAFSDKELFDQKKKKSKIKFSYHEKKRHLKEYLEKAGYSISDELEISKKVNIISGIFAFLLSLYFIYLGVILEDRLILIIIKILISWIIMFPAFIVIFWVIFYFVIDFKIYNRRKEVEEVLPDFLQLTSANINAGMPIDQALWYAVRPRFGILAKEIEEVAKSTIVGEDLGDALLKFSKKYDSVMLKRTVNLILEGIDAGGEIGPLLNKISIDIQETRIMRKDMAANVTTYVIFISFATLLAAPFLFALSSQLLSIIQNLISNINIPQNTGSSMLSISFSSSSITMRDFHIFAVSTLTVTSFFSAVIISTIRYGNVKDGIKYIPIFIIVSVTLYLIATKFLGYFLGGII